jgi:hypothetical protein
MTWKHGIIHIKEGPSDSLEAPELFCGHSYSETGIGTGHDMTFINALEYLVARFPSIAEEDMCAECLELAGYAKGYMTMLILKGSTI